MIIKVYPQKKENNKHSLDMSEVGVRPDVQKEKRKKTCSTFQARSVRSDATQHRTLPAVSPPAERPWFAIAD